jgi:hypothetical protein
MKRALLVLLPLLMLFIACRKKSTSNQKNWFCIKKDSIVSNIPALNNPDARDSIKVYHEVSEAVMKFTMLAYTRKDTIYMKNDTLQVEYWLMRCDQIDD